MLLLCAAAVAAACHGHDGDPGPQTTAVSHVKAPVAAKRGPTPDELTAGMVEAATIGSTAAPILVKFDIPDRPVVGQPTQVVVAVMPQISADQVVLSVVGSNELAVQGGTEGPVDMPAVEPTQVYRHNVKLLPTADGVLLLNLNVSLQHDDTTEVRVFSIPVIVGSATEAAVAQKR